LIGGVRGDVTEATLISLYAGVRKGFMLNNKLRRFYPYIGTGAGPVLGMVFDRQGLESDWSHQFAPSAYALIGTEIYTNNRMFVDLSFRYRYLVFNNNFINRKNFSGLSIGLGFGYGLGKQLLR
jgi:opacity protein-like surface antigen